MKRVYCLPVLIFLIISTMAMAASDFSIKKDTSSTITSVGNPPEYDATQTRLAQQQVTLTFYVLDGGVNGPMLQGVTVTALDGAGNGFKGITDSKGSVVIKGKPGTWKITFSKDGYEPTSTNYDVMTTHAAATYLERITQAQEPVALTIYIHEENLTGPQLSGVQVAGQDAAGNSFDQLTGKEGSAVISGVPGTWQFILSKDGYETASLNYNVTTTQAGAAYLKKNIQVQEQVALTIYIHEENLTGPQLSGVQVAGQDAAGNSFDQLTGKEGSAVISGVPGTWQFILSKDGYETASLNYNVTTTQAGAAYLKKNIQAQEQVALTIYIHEENLTGPQLSGVQVAGQDAAGNVFSQLTSLNGSVVIHGQPGRWQFTLSKEGYMPVILNYNITVTTVTAAYLRRIVI